MSTFLQIASRVEAAVEAYISVRDFTDKQGWTTMFKREKVSTHLNGVLIALHFK
jgi:hypothetical protein